MPEDDLSLAHRRGGRCPAPRQACFQQLIDCRIMIPDGDRRHHPKSGGVVNQPEAAEVSDQDVVAEFVLRDHASGRKRRVVPCQPVDSVLDRAMARHGRGDPGEILRSETSAVLNGEFRRQWMPCL